MKPFSLPATKTVMKLPIDYKEKTYWPIRQKGCQNCVHESSGCAAFVKFVDSVRPFDSVCTGDDEPYSVIWQTGDKARLKYITQRLTT